MRCENSSVGCAQDVIEEPCAIFLKRSRSNCYWSVFNRSDWVPILCPRRIVMQKHSRLVNLLIYIGISATIIGCAACCFALGFDWQKFVKWCGFPSATFVLFWIACIEVGPEFRASKTFWSINLIALGIHSAIWIAILLKVQEWKFVWYGLMLIEMVFFLPIRRALMGRVHNTVRPRYGKAAN